PLSPLRSLSPKLSKKVSVYDVIGLGQNLAAAYCVIGNENAEKETIRDALKFSPGARQAWSFKCPNR
ncbi:MAG: hypothetical protein WA869_06170, partial [Alloacidobacterium sp.]